MFFDNALTCPNKNGTEPKFPWDICPPPTADTTLAVIPFGKQPTTQLSLDYLMQVGHNNVLDVLITQFSFSISTFVHSVEC